jgi:hypothetical protein
MRKMIIIKKLSKLYGINRAPPITFDPQDSIFTPETMEGVKESAAVTYP